MFFFGGYLAKKDPFVEFFKAAGVFYKKESYKIVENESKDELKYFYVFFRNV